MKKALIAIVLTVLLLTAFFNVALAVPGGMPAAHGVDGRTFGGLVSDLAKEDPAALVAHIRGCGGD